MKNKRIVKKNTNGKCGFCSDVVLGLFDAYNKNVGKREERKMKRRGKCE